VSLLVDHLLGVAPAVAYVVIGTLVFAEAALFAGLVLPGETAVIIGGVLAAAHRLSLPALLCAAAARCHARRSGSVTLSVASANAWWTARRPSTATDRYTADRTSGCRNVTRSPIANSPSVSAPTTATAIPSRSDARSNGSGSPTGSAAATSNRRRASSESACASSSPKPPASCVALLSVSSSATALPPKELS
jgi:uncharacterized membrane protein